MPVRSAKDARKPRADALRNRERVLEAAKAVFSAGGSDASLEAVARHAGARTAAAGCRDGPEQTTASRGRDAAAEPRVARPATTAGADRDQAEAARAGVTGMVSHVVLFKPRAELSRDERHALAAAFESAVPRFQPSGTYASARA